MSTCLHFILHDIRNIESDDDIALRIHTHEGIRTVLFIENYTFTLPSLSKLLRIEFISSPSQVFQLFPKDVYDKRKQDDLITNGKMEKIPSSSSFLSFEYEKEKIDSDTDSDVPDTTLFGHDLFNEKQASEIPREWKRRRSYSYENHVTKKSSFERRNSLKKTNSGGSSRWRVCYKRGLPRLVY